MAISEKNKNIVANLLSIGRHIQKKYKEIECGKNSKSMTNLLDLEDMLIGLLDFQAPNFNDVASYIESLISVDLKSNLPFCMGPLLTEYTYPNLRLISRIRYECKKRSGNIKDYIASSFQDVETSLLYRSLISDSEIYLEHEEQLRHIGMNALINSPVVERAILENGMRPLEVQYDTTAFQLDLWTSYHVKKSMGEIMYPSSENLSLMKARRLEMFLDEADNMARSYIQLYKSGQTAQIVNFLACVCYFKVMIAIQNPEKRKSLYEAFRKFSSQRFEDFEFSEFVENNVGDIEEKLTPSITRVDFVYHLTKR